MSKRTKDVVRDYLVLDADGFEHPDPRPVEVPTRLKLPQRQVDRVREIIRQEMSRAAVANGVESFDEADDFSMEDVEPFSPYEEIFEPQLTSGEERGIMSSRPNGGTDKESKDGERSSGKGVVDGVGAEAGSGGVGDGSNVAGAASKSVDDSRGGKGGKG